MSYRKVLKFYKENICSLKYITVMTCFFKINRGAKSPKIQLDFISGQSVISDQWYKEVSWSWFPLFTASISTSSPPHTHKHTHTHTRTQILICNTHFYNATSTFQFIVKVVGQLYLQKKVKRQFAYWC